MFCKQSNTTSLVPLFSFPSTIDFMYFSHRLWIGVIVLLPYYPTQTTLKTKIEYNFLRARTHYQILYALFVLYNTVATHSRKAFPYKSLVSQFSRNGEWRGYLVAVTGFTWELRDLLSKKITLFTLFSLIWVMTSVITSFGVNIEWTGRDFIRWVVNFHSTGVRIEWNSLHNEWNLFTP